MRKYFLKLYNDRYGLIDNYQTSNFDLQVLFSSFEPSDGLINIDKENGMVNIWWDWDLKGKALKYFINSKEQIAYDNAYAQYYDKRYAEIPRLETTQKNYDDLVAQWKVITKEIKPKYVIIAQDNTGVVSFILKDELSPEDLAEAQQDFEKHKNFMKKYNAYMLTRDSRSEEWGGPEDSEFDSDFLTPEEMPWLPKKK